MSFFRAGAMDMKYFVVTLVLLFALFFETTLLQLPLVLMSLLLLGVLYKERWIFLAAFLTGILLDMLAFRTVGISSLFFVTMLGLVFLYERKFEIQSFFFVGIATSILSLIFMMIFGSTNIILQLIFVELVSLGFFYVFTRLDMPYKKTRGASSFL